MDKELVINGVKYIRVDDNFKVGNSVKYNNYEFYIIKLDDNFATLVSREFLSKDKIKELFKDDTDYLDDDCDVRFNTDETDNDWQNSKIREVLNTKFIQEFNKNELVRMTTNYDECKHSRDYIRLLTVREVERLSDEHKRVYRRYGYWTMSPYDFNGSSARVFFVLSDGNLSYNNVNFAYGVRFVICVNKELLKNAN